MFYLFLALKSEIKILIAKFEEGTNLKLARMPGTRCNAHKPDLATLLNGKYYRTIPIV